MSEDDGWDDDRRKWMVEGGMTFEKGTSVKIAFWVCLGIVGLVVIASMLGLEQLFLERIGSDSNVDSRTKERTNNGDSCEGVVVGLTCFGVGIFFLSEDGF